MAETRPFFAATDLVQVGSLIALLPIAATVPERFWPFFAHLASVAITTARPLHHRRRLRKIQALVDECEDRRSAAILRRNILAGYLEERLQILKEYHFKGWKPKIELTGNEHLAAALERGSGAILWICPSLFSDLISKKALHEAGKPLVHLSNYARGFAPNDCLPKNRSRFGLNCLGPIRSRVEDAYLRERITMRPDESLAYVRILKERLQANQLVSIRAGDAGSRVIEVPFGSGKIRLATGPPSLALATGAVLLPLFATRKKPGYFEVAVQTPLVRDEGTDQRQAVTILVHQYVKLLETFAARHPVAWYGWYLQKVFRYADESA